MNVFRSDDTHNCQWRCNFRGNASQILPRKTSRRDPRTLQPHSQVLLTRESPPSVQELRNRVVAWRRCAKPLLANWWHWPGADLWSTSNSLPRVLHHTLKCYYSTHVTLDSTPTPCDPLPLFQSVRFWERLNPVCWCQIGIKCGVVKAWMPMVRCNDIAAKEG